MAAPKTAIAPCDAEYYSMLSRVRTQTTNLLLDAAKRRAEIARVAMLPAEDEDADAETLESVEPAMAS